MWAVQLLGDLNARSGERSLTRFRTQKTRALFAYLAYYRRKAHPRETLIEWLWPDADIEAAQHNLRNALSSLRRQLDSPLLPAETVLLADRLSVQLNPDAVMTDVARFEWTLARTGAVTSDSERRCLLSDALDLYSGALLPDLCDQWIFGERQRLQELCFGAFQTLLPYLENTGWSDGTLALARRMMALEPLREETCVALMRQLRDMGQFATALREYDQFARCFQSELGEFPSDAIRNLAEQIRAVHRTAPGVAVQTASPWRLSTATPRPIGTVTLLFLSTHFLSAYSTGVDGRSDVLSFLSLCRAHADRYGALWLTAAEEGADLDFTFPRSSSNADVVMVFGNADSALACVAACFSSLSSPSQSAGRRSEEQGETLPNEPVLHNEPVLRPCAALHTGAVGPEAVYSGADWEQGAELLRAAHPGQVLCSEAAAVLLSGRQGAGAAARIRSLGLYRREGRPALRVFQIDMPERAPSLYPPLRGAYRRVLELPIPFTRFFGREAELEGLRERMAQPQLRLLTLTGIGGIGKTRLALELASTLAETFPAGIWFVSLADLRHAGDMGEAVLKSLQVALDPYQETLETLVEALNRERERRTLLILDNMEQLGPEGTRFVRTLLVRVPSLVCLATSRCALQVEGEQEFRLPPLPSTQGASALADLLQNPAVHLLVDRAQAVRADFQITERNAANIGRLCDRLEGIPLAIELAAAQIRVLTPAQMLEQLGDRFALLVSRRRGGAERHLTLRATLEWSFDLLSPDRQRLLAQLSMFRGGWTVAAVEAVCGLEAARDGLAHLADSQLIESEEQDKQLRFHMLETVREFAWERLEALGLAEATRQRHADFFWRMTETASYFGDKFAESLNRFQQEQENYAAIFDWILQDATAPSELGYRLIERLWKELVIRGDARHNVQRVQRLLERCDGVPEALRASALNCAANMALHVGDFLLANAWYEEGLQIARRLDSAVLLASFLTNLGLTLPCINERERALSLLQEALPLWEARGDANAVAATFGAMAEVLGLQGRTEEALILVRRATAVFRQQEDLFALCDTLNTEGGLLLRAGQPEAALAALTECLHLEHRFGVMTSAAKALCSLAEIAVVQGCSPHAARLMGAAEAIIRHGEPHWSGEATEFPRVAQLVRNALSSPALAKAWAEGGSLRREQAITFALNECSPL